LQPLHKAVIVAAGNSPVQILGYLVRLNAAQQGQADIVSSDRAAWNAEQPLPCFRSIAFRYASSAAL
jgi:hypothetical protein